MLETENILTLGMRADEARRRSGSPRVYYQRVHVLGIADVRDGLMNPEPASEVRLMDTPASFEDALNAVRAIKEAAGARPVSAFSLAEIAARMREGWGDWRTTLTKLSAAGVMDFAETPVDLLDDLNELVAMARSAGFSVRRLTIAHAVADRKAEILERIRRSVTEIGGIARVNPLPRNAALDKPTTGYEDIRMVALTRLALDQVSEVRPTFVEVDWSLYGPKLAQVALTFGADFLDAVPATTDESLGRRRGTVEDVERNIRAAGFEPQEYRPSS
jgi:aminodeoxyfutalosine synthase